MDVAANIAFGLRLAGLRKRRSTAACSRIADMLQIRAAAGRASHARCRGPAAARVAIGRALVRDPGVFLFDEPLSNLDAALRTRCASRSPAAPAATAASTIYVTHDQVEAMTLADKIVAAAPAATWRARQRRPVGAPLVYAPPGNLFVAGFIGSPKMNFIAVHGRRHPRRRRGQSPAATAQALRAAVAPDGVVVGQRATLGPPANTVSLRAGTRRQHAACRVQWVEQLGDTPVPISKPRRADDLIVRLPGERTASVGDGVHLHLPEVACPRSSGELRQAGAAPAAPRPGVRRQRRRTKETAMTLQFRRAAVRHLIALAALAPRWCCLRRRREGRAADLDQQRRQGLRGHREDRREVHQGHAASRSTVEHPEDAIAKIPSRPLPPGRRTDIWIVAARPRGQLDHAPA